MPALHRSSAKVPYNILNDHDLFDDSSEVNPTAGLKTHMRLRDRFVDRLSIMATATVNLEEHGSQDSMNVHFTRNSGSAQCRIEVDDDLQLFLDSIKPALSSIAIHRNGMLAHYPFGFVFN